MDWLNYHHLLYFWTVVRRNSVTRASEELHLTQPTLSAQIRKLEQAVGEKLLTRSGRGLVLTEQGRIVYRYADEIFSLGRELQEMLHDRPGERRLRLSVGIVDVVPKLIVYRLLKPVLKLSRSVQIVCHEGKLEPLLAELALHRLDVVISDAPVPPTSRVKVYEHLLGHCSVSVMGAASLARKYKKNFPRSLEGAPMLFPTENTILRRGLENWFTRQRIHPVVVGEFEDTALMKMFGQAGVGLFVAASVIEREIGRHYHVQSLGELNGIQQDYYGISLERRIRHPALATIFTKARTELMC